MKTASMVAAVCLVGVLLGIGACYRSERVRAAYRIRTLTESLSHAENENRWLRGEIERKKNPRTLDVAMKRGGADAFKEAPVVEVPPRAHLEVPGS
jgi:hypothetical protein